MPVREERKLVTVLFADLVGSTALAGDEDPERVRLRLERFYEAMAEEIERTGGTVEKFAGDAVMAVFGAPTALEDHAERALHAALGMQRRLHELFEGDLAMRVGVNSGEVVVGKARVGSSFVTGDAVNTCDRLQKAAEPGEVLAGERTVAAASGAFEFGHARVVEAKGKSEGVRCRPVLRALTLMRPRGVGGLRRVFVGRESELELLLATFRRAVVQSEPHLVSIVGEPGVGKTRLVRELWEALEKEEPVPLRRTGRCLPYGDGITYWALGEVLKEQFRLLDSDAPADVLARLGEREILGLALGLDVAQELHPFEARERLHVEAVAFVEELAAERPLVLLVEDLHWAEDDLLDLLDRMAREARGSILLLATSRPELLDRRPVWGGGRRNTAAIWLEPLPDDDTSRLLEELLGLELTAPVRDLFLERAEGNPFFVEELLGALIETGVLDRDGETWRAHELPPDFNAPDSVTAVLAARMDRLPPREKAALQAAAVVGRVFWGGPVVHLLGGKQEPNFSLLEERDFIRRRGGSSMAGEFEYAIKHQLTREVAYASIPKAARGQLHASFAEWLETSDPARDENASLLAYHYAEAVRPEDADLAWAGRHDEAARLRDRAVAWLRRAAELARGRYEIDEAIQLLRRGADLVGEPAERSALWREIGLCNALKFDGEAFWDAMQRSLEICPDRATCGETYGLLAFHTAGRAGMWKTRLQPETVQEWIDRALELSEPASSGRARALIARCYAGRAETEAAREAGEIAERLGDVELRSYAWDARAVAAFDERRFADALTWLQRRLELVDEISDPDHLADVYATAVAACAVMGRFREARRLARVQDELSTRLTTHHRVHGVSVVLELDELEGSWSSIVTLEQRTREVVEANLETPCIRNMRSLLICAAAFEVLGGDVEARALEQRAEALEMLGFDNALRAPRLRLALVRGNRERATQLVQAGVDASPSWYGPAAVAAWLDALVALGEGEAIEEAAPGWALSGTYFEPFALRALGAARRDDGLLAMSDEHFVALGLEWHRAQTERLLAGI